MTKNKMYNEYINIWGLAKIHK